jgi:two-component system, sensor histidine kinase and response regulator
MPLPFNPLEQIAEKRLLMTQAIAQNKARLAAKLAEPPSLRSTSESAGSQFDPASPSNGAETALPLRVMLVEDILVNQLLFRKILEKEGHQVVIAQNGLEAVELFPTAHWDMILMDVMMPTMTGLQATVLIRFIEETEIYRVPIIGVSANTSAPDRLACKAAGMDDFLPKPIVLSDLQALLAKYCTSDRAPTLPADLMTA